jgi:hypothetical protein
VTCKKCITNELLLAKYANYCKQTNICRELSMSAWTRLDRILAQLQASDFDERCPILSAVLTTEKIDRERRYPMCKRCNYPAGQRAFRENDGYCSTQCRDTLAPFSGAPYQPHKIELPRAPRKPKKPHQNPNYGFYQRQKATHVA